MTNINHEQWSLLAGEKPVLCNIVCEFINCYVPFAGLYKGSLLVTTYRFKILFQDMIPGETSIQKSYLEQFVDIPLASIYSIKKTNNTIVLRTKDMRKVKVNFDSVLISKIYEIISHSIFPQDISFLFAFEHELPAPRENEKKLPKSLGWNSYVPADEWKRQCVFRDNKWRISTVNTNFKLISTYPEALVVPSDLSDEVISMAVKFRSKGRIPAMTWIHSENRATLWRSSQPKVGVSNNTSYADEALVASIGTSNPRNRNINIIDCRAKRNAMANRAKGHGTESTSNYTSSSIIFMNISNIHGIRESYRKLEKLVTSTQTNNTSWLSSLEDTKWLHHIRSVLHAGIHAAEIIHNKGESVLIHCSHGWDRTSQVSSIAQLLLDPYYRTFKGFQVLIDKEWRHFGHPFAIRQAYSKPISNDFSPVFLQFLDCSWQIVNQFPTSFEFTPALLLVIAEELHSCRFGTFLFSSENERTTASIWNLTPSLWCFLDKKRDLFLNRNYSLKGEPKVLLPYYTIIQRQVSLWSEYYLRWSPFPSISYCHCSKVDQETEPDWQLSPATYHYALHQLRGCQEVVKAEYEKKNSIDQEVKLKSSSSKLTKFKGKIERVEQLIKEGADMAIGETESDLEEIETVKKENEDHWDGF